MPIPKALFSVFILNNKEINLNASVTSLRRFERMSDIVLVGYLTLTVTTCSLNELGY